LPRSPFVVVVVVINGRCPSRGAIPSYRKYISGDLPSPVSSIEEKAEPLPFVHRRQVQVFEYDHLRAVLLENDLRQYFEISTFDINVQEINGLFGSPTTPSFEPIWTKNTCGLWRKAWAIRRVTEGERVR
jgi:hypothetical protein